MHEGSHVLRVCVPYPLMKSASGILLGYKSLEGDFICALDVVTEYHDHWDDLEHYRKQKQNVSSGGICIVGVWQKYGDDLDVSVCKFFNETNRLTLQDDVIESHTTHRRHGSKDLNKAVHMSLNNNQYLVLHQTSRGQLPQCSTNGTQENGFSNQNTIVVMFEPKDILKSFYIMDHPYSYPPENVNTSTSSQFLHNIAESLFLYQNPTKSLSALIKNCRVRQRISMSDCSNNRPSTMFLTGLFPYLFYFFISGVKNLANKSSVLCSKPVQRVVSTPSTFSQLHHRHLDLKSAINDVKGTPNQTLRGWNCLSRHLLDVILGLCMMMFITRYGYTDTIATVVVEWAEWVGGNLTTLLHWLMGVPAGLKLNSQLDQFLGKFFLYHVELWQVYIKFLGPMLNTVLWYSVVLTAPLGISVQLSLAQDLFSTLTLHIYCFYVYAARLYSLQVYTLSSLWRLFRGKKWNVLRQRVDSADYNVDQLVLGTLLLVILLFLLPTTALYYVVFTTLRLSVLSLQGVISYTIVLLNTIPVYSLWLYVCRPKSVADNVKFNVKTKPGEMPLILCLKTISASLSTLYNMECDERDTENYKWTTFFTDLISGRLIYPWIKRKKKIE